MEPVLAEAQEAGESRSALLSGAWDGAFRRRTVLVVDDDPDVLALLGETMNSLGHRVITAEDARAALKCLLKFPSIDCVFSDVVMPNGMTGLQLMVAARAVRPGLPALLASSYPRAVVSSLGDIPQDIGFIQKPYLLNDLFAVLDEQCERQPSALPEPFVAPPPRKARRRHRPAGKRGQTVPMGTGIEADPVGGAAYRTR